MGWLQVFRLGALYSITILSFASLVLSARLISLHLPSICAAMSLGAAIITALTFPIIIFLDHFCDGTHASPIIVEIFWFSLSGILWLVASGVTAIFVPEHAEFCDINTATCREVQVVEGFSISAASILLAYASVLLMKSVVVCCTGPAGQRPARVWTATVRDTFSPDSTKSLVRASYNPSVLDIFAVKEDDDPFQRTPSFRESVANNQLREYHIALTPTTPNSATLLHSPLAASPLPHIRPPTPMYPGLMNIA